MYTLTTAKDIAARFESLSAIDDGQQWAEWSELYAAIRDRGESVTLRDIVTASKATRYAMAQSTVQDCVLAAGFTSNPHAVDELTARFTGKRPTRVHTMVRAALVAIGKGGTPAVRELADGLAGELATIDAGKKKDKPAEAAKKTRAAIVALVKLGQATEEQKNRRKARPEKSSNDDGVFSEIMASAEEGPAPKALTVAEYLAAMSGSLGKVGEAAANGKLTASDREAWAAFRDQAAAIDAVINSNRINRSA